MNVQCLVSHCSTKQYWWVAPTCVSGQLSTLSGMQMLWRMLETWEELLVVALIMISQMNISLTAFLISIMKKWSMLQQAFQKGSVDAEQCLVYTVNDFQVKKTPTILNLLCCVHPISCKKLAQIHGRIWCTRTCRQATKQLLLTVVNHCKNSIITRTHVYAGRL